VLVPVIALSRQPVVLATHPSLGVNSIAELIAAAKRRPGLGFATSGVGSNQHFVGDLRDRNLPFLCGGVTRMWKISRASLSLSQGDAAEEAPCSPSDDASSSRCFSGLALQWSRRLGADSGWQKTTVVLAHFLGYEFVQQGVHS
jgi:Tripartite tricarboxylate transporter family receptor